MSDRRLADVSLMLVEDPFPALGSFPYFAVLRQVQFSGFLGVLPSGRSLASGDGASLRFAVFTPTPFRGRPLFPIHGMIRF